MIARPWALAAILLAASTANAAADPFATPVTADVIDPTATAEWVDGRETSLANFLDAQLKERRPNDVTWFLDTRGVPGGFSGMTFGTSMQPGARHLRVGFHAPIAVGTIVTRGDVDRVSVLRADAAYPGALGDDTQWLEAERQSGHEVSLWVLPPGARARAIRFTTTATGNDRPLAGHLLGASVLSERLANLAPEALAVASSGQHDAALIVDGTWRNWGSDDSARTTPVSPTHPEWVMLLWDRPVTLRGLCALWPGFGAADAQIYVGPRDVHPREARDDAWKTLATSPLVHRYPEVFVPNWIDFGRAVTTRALRLRFTAPADESGHFLRGVTHAGKRGWLGELLALADLHDAPLPARTSTATAPHPPIAVPFTMRAPGYATIVIEDAAGRRVRNLVADTWFDAGAQVAWWDGLDESGRIVGPYHGMYKTVGAPVAPGRYRVRGLVHGPIGLHYELSVNSPGTPPWFTGSSHGERSAGGWMADHSSPAAALFLPGLRPRVMLSSPVAEDGNAVIWTDLEGNKLDGRRWIGGAWTGATALARDVGSRPTPGIYAFAGTTWRDELRLTAFHDDDTLTPVAAKLPKEKLGGLAARDGVLLAALPDSGRVMAVDVASGAVAGFAALPGARALAFDGRGRLLALAGRRLLAFAHPTPSALGEARVLVDGLGDPRALAVDANGAVYVADWGSHQIVVFDAEGRRLRTIGRAGGAVVGPYDPLRMHEPAGLTITSDGHLWVAESAAAPKRVSVWTTEGAFVKAFYGPPHYGGGGFIDPRDPKRFYYAAESAGVEFEIDWKAGTSRPRSIYWLGKKDPAAPPGDTAPETAIYVDGRQYMTNVYNSQPVGGPLVGGVWLMRGDRAVRVAAFGQAAEWPLLSTEPFRARWPAGVDARNPSAPMVYAWSDLDGDGRVTPDEITIAPGRVASLTLDEHLGFCTATATLYAPSGFTDAGVPIYDAGRGRPLAGDFVVDTVRSGSGQARALRDGWLFSSGGPARGFHDGKAMWTYPNEWPSQQAGVFSTPPTHAGELMATARVLPQTITPRASDAGELIALNGDKGNLFLMTADGLFVSTLFHDMREAPAWNMPAATRGMSVADVSLGEESFWTNLTQTTDGDVFVVGGHHHSSITRVDGLETTRRFTAPPLVLTPARAEDARLYRVRVEAARQARAGHDLMTIALRRRPIAVDGKLDDWPDAQWVIVDEPEGRLGAELGRIEAAAAVVGPRLYLAFRAKDGALLRNSGESPQMSFATGGALDLMLGTNAAADPRRDRAEAGDLRLVVTRVAGKPRAMLYRPRVPGRRGPPVAFASPWRTVELDEVDDVSAAVELAQGDGAYEVSVPLATLGLTARDGLELRGDVGVLCGDGARTLQRLYWQNKATSTVSDIPTEATLTPQLWGRMRFVVDPR